MTTVTDNDQRELEDLLEKIPVLHDKHIVDLVNGLEVAKDHIRVRESSNHSFFQRMFDAFSGKSALRQQQIDQNLYTGLESAVVWLEHLQAQQIRSDRALAHVTYKLTETRAGVQKLALRHLELREEVNLLCERMGELEERFLGQMKEVNLRLDSIDMRQSAMAQMHKEFDRWESGSYAGFSPLAQLTIVLESLSWGAFGKYDEQNSEFREQLFDKCVIALKRLEGVPSRLIPTNEWLSAMSQDRAIAKESLVYMLSSREHNHRKIALNTAIKDTLNLQPGEHTGKNIETIIQRRDLPYVFNGRTLSKRLYKESCVRLESEGLYVSGF